MLLWPSQECHFSLSLSQAINPLVKEFIAYSGLSSKELGEEGHVITKAAVSLSSVKDHSINAARDQSQSGYFEFDVDVVASCLSLKVDFVTGARLEFLFRAIIISRDKSCTPKLS